MQSAASNHPHDYRTWKNTRQCVKMVGAIPRVRKWDSGALGDSQSAAPLNGKSRNTDAGAPRNSHNNDN